MPTITIALSGMILHQEHVATRRYEMGVLHADNHFLRIKRMRDDKVLDTLSLDHYKGIPLTDLFIHVSNPIQTGLRFHPTKLGSIDRLVDVDEKDFRYIIDLGGSEFYKDKLAANPQLLNTSLLNPVIYLEHGRFYTFRISDKLDRAVTQVSHHDHHAAPAADEFKPFGRVAAEIGIEIAFTGEAPTLRTQSGDVLYTFVEEEGITYHLLNAPPDPLVGVEAVPVDHFPMIYDIFTEDVVKFKFKVLVAGGASPDPQLCGAPGTGGGDNPLRNP